ncbi:MAG: hypothetical protein LBS39_01430 [Campylobacteraceae bacterium]|nr:hypothetical protein [Campylobacteraceae bacterium]
MNSSRRFFIKMGVSLAVLAFMWGCGSEQTQTAASGNLLSTDEWTSADLETVEHEDFKIEYDREKRIVKIILKGDKGITLVSKPNEAGTRTLTTLEGESILVLAAGQHGFTTTTKIALTKDSDGYPLIKIFPA